MAIRGKKRLGEMLVDGGLLTATQLEEAVKGHKKTQLKMGQYLVREGYLNGSQIVDLVSVQLHVEKYRPDKFPIDMELSKITPVEVATKYQVAPLVRSRFLLTVAMVDPMDIGALDALEVYTNTEIEAVICTDQQLNHLVGSLYGTYSGIGGVIEEMEIEKDEEPEIAEFSDEVEVGSLQDMVQEAPVVRLVNSILSQAVREGASDVHISPEKDYVQVRFRVDGRLHEVPAPPKSMILLIISRLKILSNMDIALSKIPQDGRFTIKMDNREINIRTSTMPTIYGENMVIRLLDTSSGIYSLQQLGMAAKDRQKIEEVIVKPYGMVLSTGPTGSGKSTTLAAMIQHINDNMRRHIITVEDPIEFLHIDRKSVINQREVGVDTPSYTTALKHILRQDPDVILLGEIRDRESMEIALQAADTGHLVFSTLHTADTTQTIGRIISFFPPHQHQEIRLLIASNLRAIISMRLIRRADDRGRVPACEVLINSEAVKDCIVDPVKTSSIHNLIQEGHVRYGMQIFDQSIMKLYKSGFITYEEALYNSSNPTEFSLRVKGISGTSDKAWDGFDKVQEGSTEEPVTEEGEDV